MYSTCLAAVLLLLVTLLAALPGYSYDSPPPDSPEPLEAGSRTPGSTTTSLALAVARLTAAEKAENFSEMLAAAEDAVRLAPEQQKARFAIKVSTAAWWLGQQELGATNWRQATTMFNRIADLGRQYPQIAKAWGADALDIEAHLQLSRQMHELPQRQPDYTYRILLVFLNEVSIDQPGMHNNQLIGKSVLTDQHRNAAVLAFNSLRGYLEAMSRGKFSARFSTVEYPGTISALSLRQDDSTQPPVEMHEPDTNYASSALWPLLRNRYQEVDSIVYIWAGGSRLASAATGGARTHPLIPWTLASPLRGFIQIPGHMLLNRYAPVLVMHEFFHTIEQMADIKPAHGYKPKQRDQFPNWKGSGQLDYYRWHFDTTIPGQFTAKKEFKPERGWANLNFSTRYPERPLPPDLIDDLAVQSARIPPADRRMAIDLLQQASALIRAKNDQQALPLLQTAIKLHPAHPGIQLELGKLYERVGNFQSALEIYQKRSSSYPDYYSIRGLATANQKLKQYPQAASLHGKAADLANLPGNRLVHLLLKAHALMHDSQHQNAFTAYQQVIQEAPSLSPGNSRLQAEAYFQAGLLQADRLGSPAEGIKLLQQALAAGQNREMVQKSIQRISRKLP